MNRLNIVYLHSHDTGRYIQPYGYAVPTPHLQAFAEESVLFRQAFCAAPTCSPSRAALLTGTWAHVNGMIGLAHRGSKLNDYGQHVIHQLKPRGYHAALCGMQHLAHGPDCATKVIGYDETLPAGSGQDRADNAAAWIARRPRDQPFFLSVGFVETHRTPKKGEAVQWHNGDASPIGDARYVRPPATIPDTPVTRQDFADYVESAKRLDACMGQVVRAIDDAGLRERTIVLITTDHGVAFPAMKCNLTDHGIGVMLMLRGPQATGLTGGEVVDAMVSQVDVVPTLCELLEIDALPWAVGRSMMPLVRGEANAIRDELFAEINYHSTYEPARAVRTERYKYIRRWPNPWKKRPGPVLSNCDQSPSKSLWLDHGWRDREPCVEQLYDLVFDPNEANNRINDERYAAAVADMRRRLERWMQETNDPLLSGPVQPPSNYVLNDPDGLSPGDPPMAGR